MVAHRFSTLDGSTIAVELLQGGKRKLLRGVAAYCSDPLLGNVLKVNVSEEWGSFDFVLKESQWNGEIGTGAENGCDYQICLSADCMCAR